MFLKVNKQPRLGQEYTKQKTIGQQNFTVICRRTWEGKDQQVRTNAIKNAIDADQTGRRADACNLPTGICPLQPKQPLRSSRPKPISVSIGERIVVAGKNQGPLLHQRQERLA
jgi:hypothetical protein